MPRPKTQAEMSEADIRTLYNSFEKKDMPFAKFRQELKNVMDPNKMVKDLSDIELRKAREQMNRMKINKMVEN